MGLLVLKVGRSNVIPVNHPLECEAGITRLFGTADIADRGLGTGWSPHEEGHNWNDGEDANLTLRTRSAPTSPYLLWVEGAPFLSGRCDHQRITLFANGFRINFWKLTESRSQILQAVIEPEYWLHRDGWGLLNLVWHLPDSTRPVDIGEGSDYRQLGFCFRALTIEFPSL